MGDTSITMLYSAVRTRSVEVFQELKGCTHRFGQGSQCGGFSPQTRKHYLFFLFFVAKVCQDHCHLHMIKEPRRAISFFFPFNSSLLGTGPPVLPRESRT